jgi:hypothetical protein
MINNPNTFDINSSSSRNFTFIVLILFIAYKISLLIKLINMKDNPKLSTDYEYNYGKFIKASIGITSVEILCLLILTVVIKQKPEYIKTLSNGTKYALTSIILLWLVYTGFLLKFSFDTILLENSILNMFLILSGIIWFLYLVWLISYIL